MSVVPKNKSEVVEFAEAHIQPWTTSASAIGLTAGQVEAVESATLDARAALLAQQQAEQMARAATLAFNAKVAALRDQLSVSIGLIRVKAKSAGSPAGADEVYSLAQIPAPAQRAPLGPPGTPTDFRITLEQAGVLELSWKCANPAGSQGTIYNVRRQVTVGGVTGPLVNVGGTGVRKFVDDTIPAGAGSVTYEVTAVRSTARGPAALFTVAFGTASNGQLTATLVEAPRLAA